jgi:hypothetical protein
MKTHWYVLVMGILVVCIFMIAVGAFLLWYRTVS